MLSPTPLLAHACWESPRRGILFFEADWPQADLPSVDWGSEGISLTHLAAVPAITVGEWQGYYIEGEDVIFVLIPKDYPYVSWENEAIYLAGPFNNWDALGVAAWQFEKIKHSGHKRWQLRVPLSRIGNKSVPFKAVSEKCIWLAPAPGALNRSADAQGNINWLFDPQKGGQQAFYFEAPADYRSLAPATVMYQGKSCAVDVSTVLLSIYSASALGAQVEGTCTVFRLFAPRALHVTLAYGEALEFKVSMQRQPAGIWEGIVKVNLHGKPYAYYLNGETDGTLAFDPHRPLLDPYAKVVQASSGLGLVVDEAQVAMPKTCYCPPDWQDLIVVEAHVRDLIQKAPLDLSLEELCGYVGLTCWLREPSNYLKDLGCNAVEFQPIQAFDGNQKDYHWGYMPVNFFAPASAYAMRPDSISQISEVQGLVKSCHDAGLAVIMDVVYNHVGEPNSFYFIDKQYYLRTSLSGQLENWSGCGNDLRTEAPMTERMVIDSLIHWVKWYDVDGFRFDLADLVGVSVLEVIERELKTIKPGIILITEPWSFKGHIGEALKHTGWSSWNDGYREFLAKYVKGEGNAAGLSYFMAGSTAHLTRFPAQTVNYVESHDDRTWIDKITENPQYNGYLPTIHDVRRTHLIAGILMASLGIPMLSAGQDFLRSKNGISNTYQNGALNALDYDRQEEYVGTQAYFSDWIALRRSGIGHMFFCHNKTPREGYFHTFGDPHSTAMGLLYNANGSAGKKRLLFVVNPHLQAIDLSLPGIDPHAYVLIADHDRVDLDGLRPSHFRWKNGSIHLPGLTLACFVSI